MAGTILFFGLKIAAARIIAWVSNRKMPQAPPLSPDQRARAQSELRARAERIVGNRKLPNPWLLMGGLSLAHLVLMLLVLIPLRCWLAS